MKTTVKIMSALIAFAFITLSCQKEESEKDLFTEEIQEEGFISETGENDSKIETTSEALTPFLHKRYDATLSREEAETLFDTEVLKYEKENGRANRASSYFRFKVNTVTGTYDHSQTDGDVWARFNFLTDKGNENFPWVRLNNEGNDRENGSWDFYYFGAHVSSINWLEVKNAKLALKGTDGWYVRFFDVRVLSWDQYGAATGSTRILSDPEAWLDNTTSTGWDFYNTGNIGFGRLNF